MTFDQLYGTIQSWFYQGLPLLVKGPQLNFRRAITDNDLPPRQAGQRGVHAEWWYSGLHLMQSRVRSVSWHWLLEGHVAEIVVQVRFAPAALAWGFECEYHYKVDGEGRVVMDISGVPAGEHPRTLPRIGLELELPKYLEHVVWYGRGPGESYRDSKQANRVGVYEKTVRELHTPYIHPQENGNRTDVRWVTITDERGTGLMVVGQPTLNFSAHYYTVEQLDAARHTYELVENDAVTLHLDHVHHGLGSASCGPGPLPQYELLTTPFAFTVSLQPYTKDAMSSSELGKFTRRWM